MSRRATNSREQKQPMKVVHIKTHHVETDATSFKSVVQNLTGKDSTIAESPPRYSSSSSSSPPLAMRVKNEDNQSYGLGRSGSFKYLTRDLSFGRLLKEFPSVDELQKLLSFGD